MHRNRFIDCTSAETSATGLTLHDLVEALCETGADDRQVVAAAVDLLRTGRVRLLRPVDDTRASHR